MNTNDNYNARAGKLFDTTVWRQDTLVRGEELLYAGELVTYEGTPVTSATQKIAGVASNINVFLRADGKRVHQIENVGVYSFGRVGVQSDDAVVSGQPAYYKIATKTYGNSGDIYVGTWHTAGAAGIHAVQLKLNSQV